MFPVSDKKGQGSSPALFVAMITLDITHGIGISSIYPYFKMQMGPRTPAR